MTGLDVLYSCRMYAAEKQRLTERAERYRDAATRITAAVNENGGGGGGGTKDRLGALAVNIAMAEEEAEELDRRYAAEMAAALILLNELPDVLCGMGYRYYVQGKKLRDIADEMHYSYSYIKNMAPELRKRMEDITEERLRGMMPGWYFDDGESS